MTERLLNTLGLSFLLTLVFGEEFVPPFRNCWAFSVERAMELFSFFLPVSEGPRAGFPRLLLLLASGAGNLVLPPLPAYFLLGPFFTTLVRFPSFQAVMRSCPFLTFAHYETTQRSCAPPFSGLLCREAPFLLASQKP